LIVLIEWGLREFEKLEWFRVVFLEVRKEKRVLAQFELTTSKDASL
jgi:hypothetical protein